MRDEREREGERESERDRERGWERERVGHDATIKLIHCIKRVSDF